MIISLSKLVLRNLSRPSKKVYLVDFACYKPDDSQTVTKESFLERMGLNCNLAQDSLHFCKRILDNSGIGQSTYMPDSLLDHPIWVSLEEAEAAVFGVAEEVLRKAGVAPQEVGIVVANCSIFNPAPSLSDTVVNRFGMREDVSTFNLSGMGCSASLAAIALAYQLLQVHENVCTVSTESVTENAYMGQNRAMLIVNCVFRLGGAAILLSNRPSAASTAKYLLCHAVRTHTMDERD